MRHSVRGLISVLWLFVYNLLAIYVPTKQTNDITRYIVIALIYLPILLAILVWLEQPKFMYKKFMQTDR